MAGPFVYDRVRETSTTTGTGDFTLAGAVAGYRTFSSAVSTDTFYYCIAHQTLTEWEVGLGVLSSGDLVRSTPLMNHNGVAAAVNFSAGTKDVFITVPAQIFQDYFFNMVGLGIPCNPTTTQGTATIKTFTNGNGPGLLVFDDATNTLEAYQSTAKGYLKSDGSTLTITATTADPALADSVAGYDDSASGEAKDFDLDRLLALINPEPGGRLTLLYGDPCPSADQTGGAAPSATDTGTDIVTFSSAHGWSSGQGVTVTATGGGLTAGTLYYFNAASTTTGSFHTTLADALAGSSKVNLTASITAVVVPAIHYQPHAGNTVVVYDGTRLVAREIPAGLAAVPSALTNTMFDLFLYDNSGTLAFDQVAWSSDTARDTALTYQSGFLALSSNTTRRYVGTYRTTGTVRQVYDTQAARLLWNHYHRMPRKLKKIDSTDSWTYTTATWRSANNSTANRVEIVTGQTAMLDLQVVGSGENSASLTGIAVGIDEDGTTSNDAELKHVYTGPAAARSNIVAFLRKYPAVGYHYYQWTEYSVAAGTTTWYGDGSIPDLIQSGLLGWVMG